jgi:hypothetical protein
MEVEFMVTDSLEAIRPKLVLLKNIEDAAIAVDDMFASTVLGGREYPHFQRTYVTLILSQLALEKAVVMTAVTRVNALLMMMTRRRTTTTTTTLSIRW